MKGLCCGKRKDNGKWVYGYYAHQYGEHVIYLPGLDDEGWDHYEVDPETVRYFTGIYDCTKWDELTTEEKALFLYPLDGGKRSKEDWKGRPIFCGDIVKHYYYICLGDPDTFEIGAIYWHDKQCRFMRTSSEDDEDYAISPDCAYKVIGNIYDNKVTDFKAEVYSYENN